MSNPLMSLPTTSHYTIVKRIQVFFDQLFASINGIKVLIVDEYTSGIISVLFGRIHLYYNDVCSTCRVDQIELLYSMNSPQCLKPLYFLRPTSENIVSLVTELANPHFCEYHFIFSNALPTEFIDRLAKADRHNRVRSVLQSFIDIQMITPILFTLELPFCLPLTVQSSMFWESESSITFQRIIDGLTSWLVLSNYNTFCGTIFSTASSFSHHIVKEFYHHLNKRLHHDLGVKTGGLSTCSDREQACNLLFLMDRKEDPLTPLLTPWTYQAMVHQHIGVRRNRVDVTSQENHLRSSTTKAPCDSVLSYYTDTFFADHWSSNFGDLGLAIQERLHKYKEASKQLETTTSTDQATRCLAQEFVELQKESTLVSRHVEIIHILSTLVKERDLMALSRLEQDLVLAPRPAEHTHMIQEVLENQVFAEEDKLRLCQLYALMYPEEATVDHLTHQLTVMGINDNSGCSLHGLTQYAKTGSRAYATQPTEDSGFFQVACKVMKRRLGPSENQYTQHRSYACHVIESLFKKRSVQNSNFAFLPFDSLGGVVAETQQAEVYWPSQMRKMKQCPVHICVFFLGGVTYQEVYELYALSNLLDVSLTVGGTTVHNSCSFLSDISQIESLDLRSSKCESKQGFLPTVPSPVPSYRQSHIPSHSTQYNSSISAMHSNTSRENELELKKKFLEQHW